MKVFYLLYIIYIYHISNVFNGGGSTSTSTPSTSKSNATNSSQINTTVTYDANGTCKHMSHPHSPDDCYNIHEKHLACCHVYIEFNNHTNKTFCTPIEETYSFAPFHFTEFPINNTYYNASITCSSHAEKTCSQAHPHDLYDCRYAGDSHTSCCYLEDRHNNTNCILNGHKSSDHSSELNFKIWGNQIECSGFYLQNKIIFLIVLLNLI
jgi:hypothetical protein